MHEADAHELSTTLASQPAQSQKACVLTVDNAGQHMSYEVDECSLPIGKHTLYTTPPAHGQVVAWRWRFKNDRDEWGWSFSESDPAEWKNPDVVAVPLTIAGSVQGVPGIKEDGCTGALDDYDKGYVNGWNCCLATHPVPSVPDNWQEFVAEVARSADWLERRLQITRSPTWDVPTIDALLAVMKRAEAMLAAQEQPR